MWQAIIGAIGRLMRRSGNDLPDEQEAGGDRPQQGSRRIVCGNSFAAVTDVGRVRDHNEDCFAVANDGGLFIVADGLGGHAAGEIASAMAVDVILAALSAERRQMLQADPAAIEAALREAFASAHARVRALADGHPSRRGMGTTLIAGWIAEDALYTCHAGDVRAYVESAGTFRQLTEDHSFVAALVRAGELTLQQTRHHPARSQILQAVGVGKDIRPDICKQQLAEGDLVLLCSDGLWDELEDGKIASVISTGGSLRDRALELVERANAAGGEDNITLILYEHAAGEPMPRSIHELDR